jgi:putative transposase
MTKVWTAHHGWVYLHAIIDCCTRELVGWSLELRCRDDEAIACVEAAVMDRGVRPGQLTLGTDNGSQPRFPTAASVVLVARRHDPRGQGPRPMTAALATHERDSSKRSVDGGSWSRSSTRIRSRLRCAGHPPASPVTRG